MAEERLIKLWNNWEDGVGYLRDTGERNGMYSASSILGLNSELRPAPFSNVVTVDIPENHHFQYYLEEPATATETPAFDATASGTGDASSINWSHTVGTNAQRLLVVCVSIDGGVGATSVDVDGVALTNLVSTVSGSNEVTTDIWYLINPASGGGTITVSAGAAPAEMVGGSTSWSSVDQSAPFGTPVSSTATGTSPSVTVTTATGQQIIGVVASEGNVTHSAGTNETERWDGTAGVPDVSGAGYTQAGSDGGVINPTISGSVVYVIIAVPIIGPPTSSVGYMYAIRGRRTGGDTAKMHKINLTNESFATVETSSGDDFHDLTPLEVPGQPARYQGKWYIPGGNDQVAKELTTVGTGSDSIDNDTLTGAASSHTEGADHLANLNFQLVGIIQNGTNPGGVTILQKDGNPLTESEWGSVFEVGDRNERAGGLRSLGGAVFVINPEGIFSFNSSGRSGLVFEDFRVWKSAFKNIPMQPWNGGLVIPHPSGLLFYSLGRRPISIGVDANRDLYMIPPSGPTELHGGRHHGTHPVGDFLYALHQPDISSTTVNIMCGYTRTNNPLDITWQILGTSTLQDNDHMLGCFVALQGRPLSTTYVTPTLWFGNGDDLNYIVLDARGSPFRSRADTHKLVTSGDAYMSEIVFDVPTRLTRVVVYTKDMAANDEWTISGIADNGSDTTYGKTIVENGRAPRSIDQNAAYSLMLHVKWTATSSSSRVPPTITRIELWGMTD